MSWQLIDFHPSTSSVRLAAKIAYSGTELAQVPFAYPSQTIAIQGGPIDEPILRIIRGMIVNGKIEDSRKLIGYPGYQDAHDVVLTGDAPINRRYNGAVDQKLFSSLLSNLRGMHRSVLTRDPSMKSEWSAFHANVGGTLHPLNNQDDLYTYVSSSRTLEGYSFARELNRTVGHTKATHAFKLQVPSLGVFNPQNTTANVAFPSYPWYWLHDFLHELVATASFSHEKFQTLGSVSWRIYREISNVKVRYDSYDTPGVASFSYDYYNYRDRGGSPDPTTPYIRWDRWRCEHLITISSAGTPTSLSSSTGPRDFAPGPFAMHYYTAKPIENGFYRYNGDYEESEESEFSKDFTSIVECIGSRPTVTNDSALVGAQALLSAGHHRAHHSLVQSHMRELTPATFYSSAAALEDFLEVYKTNWLEFFKDSGQLLELIPDVGLLLKAIVDLRNLRLDGVLRLGDFLADTYLKYQFGQVPTAEAIAELNRLGPQIENRVSSILDGDARIIHGKFDFDITEGVLSGCHLSARSKLTIRMTDESFIRTVVGLKASGLIPSLSQLWEAYPLSFIVDWFTNLQQRYSDIDTQFFFLCVDVKECVHSVTVYRPVEAVVLEAHGLGDSGSPSFKSYSRYVSYAMPTLRGSPHDFRQNRPSPSAGVGGSLAWVFSR